MAIRLGSVLKSVKRASDIPSVKNISKFLYDDPNAIDVSLNQKLLTTIKENPHTFDQIQSIDTSLSSGFISKGVNKKQFAGILEGGAENIKTWYQEIDSLKRSRQIIDDFEKTGGITEKRGIRTYVKEKIRSAEYRYKQTYPIMENNLKKFAFQKLDRKYHTDISQTFDYLLAKPEAFEAHTGITQDSFLTSLLGKDVPEVKASPVLRSIQESFKKFDEQVIGYAQDLGVPIGQLDDYLLPFSIPKDSPYYLGADNLKNLFQTHTKMREKEVDLLVSNLFKAADSTTQTTGMGFYMRKIRFNDEKSELDFYRAVNQLNSKAPMLRLALEHKQRLVKKAALISQWGNDPVRTFNKAVNYLMKGQDKIGVKEADNLKKNFQFLLDSYDGKLNITSHSAEQVRQAVSMATSITTGAVSSGFVRNLITDFNVNLAATGQAFYNPKYGIGSAALGIVRDFYGVVSRVPKMFKREKGFVRELLESMEFATSMDSLSHHGLVHFEDIYDVTPSLKRNQMDKLINFLRKGMDTVYTASGQHSLVDVRRFRHLMSMQNMWLNTMKRYSYDEWLSKADNIGKNQLAYLDSNLGLGRNEFEFMKQSPRLKLSKNMEFISRDSILESSDELANAYKKSYETARDFKIRVANSWQNLMYLSTHDASPIPMSVDSLSPHLYGAGSWVRLLVSIPLKFADIAQSQWVRVAERIAMTTYGNKNKLIGFDKSLAKYGYASGLYLGSSIGVQWANDISRNRKPTDMTNPMNVFKALMGSGYGGFLSQLGGSIMNLYGPSTIGSAFPVAAPSKSVKRIFKTLEKDPELFWYQVAEEARKNSGIGNMWYARGVTTNLLQNMLLSPSEKEQLNYEFETWRLDQDRKDKEKFQEFFEQ